MLVRDCIAHANYMMREAKYEQSQLYDKLVMDKILNNCPQEEVTQAYKEYEEKLHGFNANGFERCIHAIVEDDEEIIDKFSSSFAYIPEYLQRRNTFQEQVKDILDMDGDTRSKQDMIDAIDRKRTNAHNGVISLFNMLNDYASEHGFASPYPTPYQRFDMGNETHRNDVAQILTKHQPLFEIVHEYMSEKFKETGKTLSLRERYQTMSLKELCEVARNNLESKKNIATNTQASSEAMTL